MKNFILQGKTPVIENDPMKWAAWFGSADRTVDRTEVDTFTVSTVFLGIDHSFGSGLPVLFETMVFSDYDEVEIPDTTRRYRTWSEAEQGHAEVIQLVEDWCTEALEKANLKG
jgi:hypothetical protein